MENNCPFCEAREWIEREWIERNAGAELEDQARPEGETEPPRRVIATCKCGGVNRFIVYGAAPVTEEEAREFFRALMEAFELSKSSKSGWGIAEFKKIFDALDKHESLATFAAELDVSLRKAQDLVKRATLGGTFRQYQAWKASRGKSRMFSRLKFPRSRRRR